jgi:hypothetical protein
MAPSIWGSWNTKLGIAELGKAPMTSPGTAARRGRPAAEGSETSTWADRRLENQQAAEYNAKERDRPPAQEHEGGDNASEHGHEDCEGGQNLQRPDGVTSIHTSTYGPALAGRIVVAPWRHHRLRSAAHSRRCAALDPSF